MNEIVLCFSRLGFNIRSKYIFTDLTKAELFAAINTGIYFVYCFVFFGFTTYTKLICFTNDEYSYLFSKKMKNPSRTEADIFFSVLKDDLSEVNCLIVFFLTHGTNKNKLMAKDKTFSATAAWKQFSEHKDLQNKPKMFIFQVRTEIRNVSI